MLVTLVRLVIYTSDMSMIEYLRNKQTRYERSWNLDVTFIQAEVRSQVSRISPAQNRKARE